MLRSINKLLVGLFLSLMVVMPVYATTYQSTIAVAETSGNSYTMLPVVTSANVSALVSNGFIASDGLDTAMEGITGNHLLTTDKILYNLPVAGNSSNSLLFKTNQTPMTSMPIITGYGGYVTVSDAAALELGNNFEWEASGYFNGSSYGYLGIKNDAYIINNSASGEITASIVTGYSASYPTVAGSSAGATASGTSHSITMPTGSAGDMLLIVIKYAATVLTPTAGWYKLSSDEVTPYMSVYYTRASSTGGVFTATTAGPTAVRYVAYRISGYGFIEVGSSATGTSTSPDPPSLTASWGSKANLWIAVAGCDNGVVTTAPSGYGALLGSGSQIASATKNATAATEDAGVFSISVSALWRAFTLVISPAPTTISVTATGVTNAEHDIKITADTTNLKIYLDTVEKDSEPLAGASVTNTTANHKLLIGNVMPYADYVKITVSGSLVAWYQPNTIISGTTLPDRQGADQNGTITWGSNPVSVSLSPMISSNTPVSMGSGSIASGTSGLGNIGAGDIQSIDDRTNPGTFLDPLINVIADAMGLPNTLVWLGLYIIALLFAFMTMARLIPVSLLPAGVSSVLVSLIFYLIGVLDWYVVAFGVVVTGACAAIDSRQSI